jgi:beta-phosphoglucomutase family hydrolase
MASDPASSVPRGFIFDLDGVLVDTVPAHIEAWGRMFREFGYPFDAGMYEHHIDGRPRVEALRSVMYGATPERIAQAATVKNGYFLENLQKGLFNQFESSARFVRAWKAKGVRMATASSSVNVRLILRTIGLIDAFDVIVGGDDVQLGKPEPEVFLKAAQELGLGVGDCVVFEDAKAGVQAAKAGGFFCVGILRYGEAAKLVGADRIIRDLGDISEDDTSFWNHG